MGVVINQSKTLERIEYVILFMVYMSGLDVIGLSLIVSRPLDKTIVIIMDKFW